MTDADRLRDLLDSRSVMAGAADMAPYARDFLNRFDSAPVAVVRPDSTAAVAKAVGWCVQEGIAIVPQGGTPVSAAAPSPPASTAPWCCRWTA